MYYSTREKNKFQTRNVYYRISAGKECQVYKNSHISWQNFFFPPVTQLLGLHTTTMWLPGFKICYLKLIDLCVLRRGVAIFILEPKQQFYIPGTNFNTIFFVA